MQSASSEAEQFFDASSHVASSVSSLSRDNSLTAALPPFSAMSGGPASDVAQLDTDADDQEPAGSAATEVPPVTSEPSEVQSVTAAPSSIPTIPDDPSMDPLEGDAVPLGNLSPLSGDPQLWWNSGEAISNATAASSTPEEAGGASLVSLEAAGATGAPAADPFAAAAAEPVLHLENDDSEPWRLDKGVKQASDTDAMATSLEATTNLFGGLQTVDCDDEDGKSEPAQPAATSAGEATAESLLPEASSIGVGAVPGKAPASSSPPSASSSPRAEASQTSIAPSSPPIASLSGPTAGGYNAGDPPRSFLAAQSSEESGGRPVRLPVSVPASANERTSSDWLPVRPPVATGASHVTPSPSRVTGGPKGAAAAPAGMGSSVVAESLRHPDDDSLAWLRSKSRHYFIISNGGRPIYTRHGQPNDAAAVSALLFGLASLAHDALGEMPHTFRAGGLTLSMRARRVKPESPRAPRSPSFTLQPYSNLRQNGASGPALSNVAMITACSCKEPLPESVLQVHLELLQLQLLVWTSGKYERVLVDNPTLDTTAALSGTDASFEGLLERLGSTMDFLMQAVETLRIRPILRGAAEAALRQAIVDCNGVFGVVACGHQLVAKVCHPQLASSHHPHGWDILLLLNFVISNSSYRTQLSGQQAWVPFCLPKCSPHCFHFVYVHHPKQESPLYIALVCRSQQDFFSAHSVREPLMATLSSTEVIQEAEHNACTSPFNHRMPVADIPLPEQLRHVQGALWHFAVARCELKTFTQTAFAPLASEEDREAAVQDCMRLHASMWSTANINRSHDPMPVQWRVGAKWAILGVIERGQYEAFAVLDPLTQKTEAMALFNHVLAYMLDNPECWPQDPQPKVTEGSGFWSSTTPDSIRTRTL